MLTLQSVPKRFVFENLLFGAAWGLVGSGFPIILISINDVISHRGFDWRTVSSISWLCLLITPSMALGNLMAFLEWWAADQKIKNWISPVSAWGRTITLGLLIGTLPVLFTFWIMPPSPTNFFSFQFMNQPVDLSSWLLEMTLTIFRSFILLPGVVMLFGYLVSLFTVFPITPYFSRQQRLLWQRLAIQTKPDQEHS